MAKEKFICKNCGKEYYSAKENSKFCSVECKHSYNQIKYNCDCCGKEMVVYRNRFEKKKAGQIRGIYCSTSCSNIGAITSVKKICEYCGKEFSVFKSVSEEAKFCSDKCYNAFRAERKAENKKKCIYCGKEFHSKTNKFYCSKECRIAVQTAKVKCVCDYCGKEYYRIKSEAEKAEKHFCSKACMYDFMRWPEEDVAILKKYYRKIRTSELQEKYLSNHSVKAIKSEAGRRGLWKSRIWSEAEINVIKENYSKTPLKDMVKFLPNRTAISIQRKADQLGIPSHFRLTSFYSDDDIKFLKENYLNMTNEELAAKLNRTPYAIEQKLRFMELSRPYEINKSGYTDLCSFIRSRLSSWKEDFRRANNYTCQVTGKRSNIVVHHCRSFNTLLQQAMELTDFQLKDKFEDYDDASLLELWKAFFDLQSYYGEYICVTESIHILFHKLYGYGDNTMEQWNEFVERYKSGEFSDAA